MTPENEWFYKIEIIFEKDAVQVATWTASISVDQGYMLLPHFLMTYLDNIETNGF